MYESIVLPEELLKVIGSETKDFAVKAGRAHSLKTSLFMILFGAFWLFFSMIFVLAFIGPLFKGKEVEFLANDVPTVAGPGNLGPLVIPGLILGLFVFIGLVLLGIGLRLLFKKGGYFVGTPERLINYYNGSYRSIDWEQFSGDIQVSGNSDRGNITLGMRTGRMVSSKNGGDRYVADEISMNNILNVNEIEQICRKRIKENDPTPPANQNHFSKPKNW